MEAVGTIVQYLEKFAPRQLAADWDNVGLLLGDRSSKLERILTCLTITPEVVAEAIDLGAKMIVTHHPILFRSTRRLTTDTTEGKMLWSMIQAGISVYSPHTAFDNTAGGINEMLAQRLDMVDVTSLRAEEGDAQCKVVVFVAQDDLSVVSEAMFHAGAGNIGEYSQCSFRVAGTGTFFGSGDANPAVGTAGHQVEAPEWRLEAVCPERKVDRVISAMRKAHSYEEPAYDVYRLRPEPSPLASGRKGRLKKPLALDGFAQEVKRALNCSFVQMVGDSQDPIEEVAIVCGAGGEMLSDAIRQRVDVFLTGEMRFHDCLRAQAEGIAVCLPGHYATERFAVEELAKRLQAEWPDLVVTASEQELDPLRLIT